MMKAACIPLKPHSRFHFGELKLDHDLALTDTSLFAHSDTLFSALVNAYSNLSGDATNFIEHFKPDAGSIKISSVFYYLQAGENTENKCVPNKVYFLPKPVFIDIKSPKTAGGSHKKRNKVKFVSAGVWQNGFEADKWFEEVNPKYVTLQKNTFVMTKAEHEMLGSPAIESIASVTTSPKSPKRVGEGQGIYYQSDVETGSVPGLTIGLYFFYEATGQAEIDLRNATNVMAFTGIGGEIKNTGRTVKDEPEFCEMDFSTGIAQPKYICVSMLNPADADELAKVEFYTTTLRGGRVLGRNEGYSDVVRMIEEGALITSPDIKGRLVELGPDEQNRTIYRCGIPFLIPVNYGN